MCMKIRQYRRHVLHLAVSPVLTSAISALTVAFLMLVFHAGLIRFSCQDTGHSSPGREGPVLRHDTPKASFLAVYWATFLLKAGGFSAWNSPFMVAVNKGLRRLALDSR